MILTKSSNEHDNFFLMLGKNCNSTSVEYQEHLQEVVSNQHYLGKYLVAV
jgi:hypothetical protein